MKCELIINKIIEAEGDENYPLPERLALNLHLFFCRDCNESLSLYRESRALLAQEAMPPAPDMSASILTELYNEEGEPYDGLCEDSRISFSRWVITGCIVMVSLVSAFFGFDFMLLNSNMGPEFVLYMGITIGLIISAYVALFIGSHLKELSKRFKLHS